LPNTIIDKDYLFLTTRVRSLECNMLDRDRMDEMLEAASPEEAMRVLSECGYEEPETVNVDTISEMLAEERDKVFEDLGRLMPHPTILDVFRIKYDYHNAKVLLKARDMGVQASKLLISAGRVSTKILANAVRSGDDHHLPSILSGAVRHAREIITTSHDPQKMDFLLDREYFKDMLAAAHESGSKFLEEYVKISIDIANLRSVVRARRMEKGGDFLADVLYGGGNIEVARIMNMVAAGGTLEELYATTSLREAAEAGAAAMKKGSEMIQFEKLCDDAITTYIKKSKYASFGEAPVIAYLVAKENEFTAIRIIMNGCLAGIPADTIRERLRDCYV